MLSRTLRAGWAPIAALLVVCATAACGADRPASGRDVGRAVGVVTAFYPLQFVAERVGGPAVSVSDLTKPGAEPHDLELNPRQVGEISQAGLVVYLKGLQPAVDSAVAQEAGDRAFDVAGVEPLLDAAPGGETEADGGASARPEAGVAKDPHVWLDPARLATVADRLAERLGAVDSAHAADYAARAGALRADLSTLDREYAQRLATCQRRQIVTSHSAFQYLALRYRLTQVGVTGVAPDVEASAQRYAEVAELARRSGATTIFFERLVSPKVAETVAREIGAKTAVLDPLEGPPADGDYLSGMRANLTALVEALGCR